MENTEKKCLKCGCKISNTTSDYCPDCSNPKKDKVKNAPNIEDTAEYYLNIIAALFLVLGVLASIGLIIKGVGYIDRSNEELAMPLILQGIGLLVSSFLLREMLKVLCNISNNIREINKKMKG